MKTLMTAAFALSLLGGAANAQQQDDQRHQGLNRPAPHAPASASAPSAPGGRPQPGGGAQYSHGNGPAFGPQARPQGQAQPQGFQGRPQGQGPQPGYQGRPQGPAQGQGYQGRPGGPAPQAFGPAPRDYPRGPGGGHDWNAGQRFRGPAYYFPRGFGSREWSFGEFLPGPYFDNDYVLSDYWDYGLPTPPYGFEWVRVGSDALLVRPVDGYILDVAHNLFW